MNRLICTLTIGCIYIIHDSMELKQCYNCFHIREMEHYDN